MIASPVSKYGRIEAPRAGMLVRGLRYSVFFPRLKPQLPGFPRETTIYAGKLVFAQVMEFAP